MRPPPRAGISQTHRPAVRMCHQDSQAQADDDVDHVTGREAASVAIGDSIRGIWTTYGRLCRGSQRHGRQNDTGDEPDRVSLTDV